MCNDGRGASKEEKKESWPSLVKTLELVQWKERQH